MLHVRLLHRCLLKIRIHINLKFLIIQKYFYDLQKELQCDNIFQFNFIINLELK